MTEREPLSQVYITAENHPHETDYYGFVTEDGEILGPLMEPGKRYEIRHLEPIEYTRKGKYTRTVLVTYASGTFESNGIFSDATVTFVDPKDPSHMETVKRDAFPFVFYQGDQIQQLIAQAGQNPV